MPQANDLSRCLAAVDQDSTLIGVVEMSQSSWLVAGIIPGIARHPAKTLAASERLLLSLLRRWREEAAKTGRTITRIAVASAAGRPFDKLRRVLAGALAAAARARRRGEAHVIQASSIAVWREHRRAKSERRAAALVQRALLGWLRGEREHCSMAAILSLAEEDAKRPSRARARKPGGRAHAPGQPDQGHPGARAWASAASRRVGAQHRSGWLSCAAPAGGDGAAAQHCG
jgi:transposase